MPIRICLVRAAMYEAATSRRKEVPPLMIRMKVALPEPGGIETGFVRVLNLPQQIHMGRRPGSGCVETDLHEALPFLPLRETLDLTVSTTGRPRNRLPRSHGSRWRQANS